MNKILAFIASVVVATVFSGIFGAISYVLIAIFGLSPYYPISEIVVSIFNIFLSFYVGYKVYKRITRVKENKAEE
jgi:hypothetical protein